MKHLLIILSIALFQFSMVFLKVMYSIRNIRNTVLNLKAKILNTKGTLMKSIIIRSKEEMDLSELPIGVCLLKTTSKIWKYNI